MAILSNQVKLSILSDVSPLVSAGSRVLSVINKVDRDIPVRRSAFLGAPVYSNMDFYPQSYETLEGDIVELEEVKIDAVVMVVNQNKRIVKTPLIGRDGTAKEYVNEGDYVIRATGLITDRTSRRYPIDQVERLHEHFRAPVPLKITSRFLQQLGIDYVYVERFEWPQFKGMESEQVFECRMISEYLPPIVINDGIDEETGDFVEFDSSDLA